MGIPVLILGESGSGKSASLRNLNKEDCFLIQPIRKPLPFRNDWEKWDSKAKTGSVVNTDDVSKICNIILYAESLGKKVVIIDDSQYIMANEFMRRCSEKSYEKYVEIGAKMWHVINTATECAGDTRVYFLSHTESDSTGKVKIKTIGKMLDEKVTLEGMFTIVIGASVVDGKHVFTTKNTGMNTLKAPMEMFDNDSMDNDLLNVDETIVEYYNLNAK